MTNEKKELVDEYVRDIGVNGNRSSLNELYLLVRDPLYKILSAYYNNYHDIEEIVIDIMDVVVTKASKRISYTNSFNWIIKIGKNLIRNMLRKNGRRKEILLSMPIPVCSKVDEFKVLLNMELKNLKINERRLIYFKFYCKFKIDEIAILLDMSKATIHRKLAELYESLKEKLK